MSTQFPCQLRASSMPERTVSPDQHGWRARAEPRSAGSLAPAGPSGTITFLFTDIEGSTRRWDTDSAAMQAALARHDAIVRAAVERLGGYVFKTVGDSFHAAFATAPAALNAAVTAQRALAAEDWGGIAPGAVRMALHTGTADERDGDYFGPALNRVARLRDAGHGGQILLSQAAAALVRGQVPDGVELRDLGVHHLRGLTKPERVYQAAVWGLPADFAPLRFVSDQRPALPTPLTSLVGREGAIADVTRLVSSARLVTITGPGGVGKTRLALAVANSLYSEFADGVVFVDLAPLTSRACVEEAIAGALDLSQHQEAVEPARYSREGQAERAPLRDRLVRRLRERQTLLILDTFEHVREASPLISELLAACSRLHILVTSRAALRLRGEQELAVGPLSLPDRRQPGPGSRIASIAAAESVQLFVARAQAAKPDFALTEENADTIAAICARLEGLPLAIELVAARLRVLSPHELAERLIHPLTLLTAGARDLPERQRSLRETIRWSYDLLSTAEQALFCRLAVCADVYTLEAAEALADDGNTAVDVLECLSALVELGLLRREEDVDGTLRFAVPELVRQFGVEQAMAWPSAERPGVP